MKRYALLVAVVFAGCIVNPRPTPEPNPVPKTERIVATAMRDYAAGMSQSFADAAAAKYTDASKANADLAGANKAARQAAFAPLDAILDDTVGGDKWDADRAAKLFKELSVAFDKAAK